MKKTLLELVRAAGTPLHWNKALDLAMTELDLCHRDATYLAQSYVKTGNFIINRNEIIRIVPQLN